MRVPSLVTQSIVRDANILLAIPALIEDLNEAGQEVELTVTGYEWAIKHAGGSIICHSWQDVHTMLQDMLAKLNAEEIKDGTPD